MVAMGLVLWTELWPFQQKPVVKNLEQASDSQVRLRGFHRTYFPSPGCVIEGVEFYHGDSSTPLITIQKLTIRGSYVGIVTRRLSGITAENLHVYFPPLGSGEAFHAMPSKIGIDEIVVSGAVLEFALRKPNALPLRFEVHKAVLRGVGWNRQLSYEVKMHNPVPPGEITAAGKFGAWNGNDPGQSPVSGEYRFDGADLSVFDGIAGTLSSAGKFSGTLGHIDVAGATDTPDFEVKTSGHTVQLKSDFSAYVDAIHGDTFLKRVDAQFGRTRVLAEGSVARSANGQGKTVRLDLRSSDGRIEDMLLLFVSAKQAPMSGKVSLDATLEVPPGEHSFLQKLKAKGEFGVGAGSFSAKTQEGVDKLSAGARGEKETADPETVVTDLTGKVEVKDGTSSFADLSLGIPGAHARMHGTFNLINDKVDLRGLLRVDTKISNATSGGKALLLKMMDPLFRKKAKGEVLPVRISGTYQHPAFGLDFQDKAARKKELPKFLGGKTK